MKSLKNIHLLKLILTFSIFLFACEEKKISEKSTWSLINEEIFAPNCANCHFSGSTIARQSGLDFSSNNIYNNLVDVKPKNLAAQRDGLVIVSSAGGMKGLSKSYLWEKINAYEREHFLSDHPDYGQLMPPGDNFLTDGQLQFVRTWIEEGAPNLSSVADEILLQNTNKYQLPNFTPLDKPSNGFQLHLEPFDVQPDYEKEFFVYTDLKLDEDKYVNRIEIEMRSGSHHFLLYTFDENTPSNILPEYGEIRDLRDENGILNIATLTSTQYHIFFNGTQWPSLDFKLPEGVAFHLPKGTGIDQNSHYVNYTDSTMIGEVYTNFHTVEKSEVKHVAQLLNLSNTAIILPPNKVTTLEKTFPVNEKIFLGQVNSHAHQKMTEFIVQIVGGDRNGETIYWTDDWDHPPIINYDPPIELNKGQSIKLIATYNNNTNKTVRFGFKSTDEMMILFGWFYK